MLSGGQKGRVVVKKAEWWLDPTTANQCGQNPGADSIAHKACLS